MNKRFFIAFIIISFIVFSCEQPVDPVDPPNNISLTLDAGIGVLVFSVTVAAGVPRYFKVVPSDQSEWSSSFSIYSYTP